MKGFFVQVGLVDGQPKAINTGKIMGQVGAALMLQFQSNPPRNKILPVEHPIIQSLEIFETPQQVAQFIKDQLTPPPAEQETPAAAPATRQLPRKKPTTLRLVPQQATLPELEPTEEDLAEEKLEAIVDDYPVEEVTEPEALPELSREEIRNQKRARSTTWKVRWKDKDTDDTYVNNCSSPPQVKKKIAAVFGPQNDSDYLSLTRILDDEIPDDRNPI